MAPPPENGNELLIPLFNAEDLGKPSTVTWSQNLSTRTAQYYPLVVDIITTGEQCSLFIAAEFYKTSTANNPKHVSRVGELLPGGNDNEFSPLNRFLIMFIEGYKLRIDSNMQYGQKNIQGELRFLVYHDKERKPYQHRFIETALGSAAAGKAQEVAKQFLGEAGGIAGSVADLAKNFVGDFLRTF